MTALMALAASYAVTGSVLTLLAAEWFIGFSMVVLALLKPQNIWIRNNVLFTLCYLAVWVGFSVLATLLQAALLCAE